MFGITVDDIKAYIGYTDSSRDLQLEMLLDAGFAVLKEITGRNLERAIYKDTFQFRESRHYVREFPIQEIEEILVGETPVPATDYLLFEQQGYLHFKNPRYFSYFSSYMTVQYVGGYEFLPADMKLALFNSVQAADNIQKQNTQFGGTVKRLSVYDVGVTDLAVPKDGIQGVMRSSMMESLAGYLERHRSLGGWVLMESEYVGPYLGSP